MEQELNREIGAAIRAIRKRKGVALTALAARLGVTYQQLQKIEKGANKVSAARLLIIAALLDAPLEDFLPERMAVTPPV